MPFIFPAALKGFCNLGPIYPLNRVYAWKGRPIGFFRVLGKIRTFPGWIKKLLYLMLQITTIIFHEKFSRNKELEGKIRGK